MLIDKRLVTFLEVAELRSFTKAAERLNLTQPAVSQHVRYLENLYGLSLVRRVGRHVEKTEAGAVLEVFARDMLALDRRLASDMANRASAIKRYRLGATKTIGAYVVPELLGGYRERHPDEEVVLEVGNTEDILRRLDGEELDLALVEGFFDRSRYESRLLSRDELVLTLSPMHLLAAKSEVDLEEVLEENLIIRERGSGTRDAVIRSLRECGFGEDRLKVFMEIGDITAIKSLVEWNLGCSFISLTAIDREIQEGRLRTVAIRNFSIEREFRFAWKKAGPASFIASFVSFCEKSRRHKISL